jgi:hypothetical protein
MMSEARVGDTVEIKEAFSWLSGRRDLIDDIACCEAKVLALSGNEALVFIVAKGDVWVSRDRLGLVRRT